MLACKDLPYGLMVASAIFDRMDYLDANPGYRGLTVKQSDKRYAPGQIEI